MSDERFVLAAEDASWGNVYVLDTQTRKAYPFGVAEARWLVGALRSGELPPEELDHYLVSAFSYEEILLMEAKAA
jgi:hypothetical protein